VNDWDIKIYPNPANDIITVEYKLNKSQIIMYSISDLSGKKYLEVLLDTQSAGEHSFSIDIEDLPKGNYILQINEEGKSINKTISKI
jgi:hypothetical protein